MHVSHVRCSTVVHAFSSAYSQGLRDGLEWSGVCRNFSNDAERTAFHAMQRWSPPFFEIGGVMTLPVSSVFGGSIDVEVCWSRGSRRAMCSGVG